MCLATLGGLVTTFGVFAGSVAGSASAMPSGQVMYGNTTFSTATMTFTGGGGTIEPAYNDGTGTLIYLQTPNGSQVHPNDHNVAPLYLPIYPKGSIDPASLNCAHIPADNCPDHGPLVAGLAMGTFPTVYGNGVAGHDHLAGIASSGGDFNVIWEPVVVLFNPGAPIHHLTTLAEINQAAKAGQVTLIPLPSADFHCSVVSAAAYARGKPAPTVVGP
jgi:hypothetical protein